MADVNANIGVNIDTSDALAQLKNLQRQISQFHSSISKSSETAGAAQRDLQKNFLNSVNSIQGFSAELKTIKTTAESFTNSLEKNKLSVREYFRYAAGATGKFNKTFSSEFSTIEKTAIERVKTLQTQYIKMGRDASGAMQAIAVRPAILNMEDLGTKTAIAAQKQVLFNQLVKQGSTNLLNFGKNTQWAGRQLMVGFTIPLMVFGSMASRTFMKLEEEVIKFKKVYGDLFTSDLETEQALEQIEKLADGFTKYGVTIAETVKIAADAAAAGFSGVDLQRQTEQALRLSILGQLEQQKALATTISLQNAFKLSSEGLADAINFLNAVENQSVVALDDITTAIPKVAPVINALGGDVKDLAFFIAAMKESGVAASEGANALKSSLGRLVNPTKAASDFLLTLGINVRGIVERNAGNLQAMLLEVGSALDKLDPLNRSRAIERLFGKFQFARMSALFDNINREGSQAARVLDLSQASAEELARAAESELGVSAASSMNKFRSAVEQLQKALAPVGELFLQIATPFVDFGTKLLEAFNKLPDGVKKTIGTVITVLGGIAPILLMTFGLINNGIANMIKFFATVRIGYLKITGQAQGIGEETQYMTQEQLEAAAAAASLDQAHSNLTQRFTVQKDVLMQLKDAYEQATAAGERFVLLNPGMIKPGFSRPQGFAKGGFVGGSGNKDTIPALLTPGEFVIKKDEAKQFLPILQAINDGRIPGFSIGGIVAGQKSVSVENKSYETLTSRSPQAIEKFIDRLLKAGISMDKIVEVLDKVQSSGEKLTAKNVEAVAKTDEAIQKAIASVPRLVRMHLQTDEEVLPSGQRMIGSLVRGGLGSQNDALKFGQSIENFSRDWGSVQDGLITTLKAGGLNITEEVRKLAQDIDNEIHDAAIAIAKATNVDVIDDKLLAVAARQVIDRNIAAGGTRGDIASTLDQQSRARVLAPATKSSLVAAGQIQDDETWTSWVKKNVAAGLAVLKKGTGEIQMELEGELKTIARIATQEARDELASLSDEQARLRISTGRTPGGSFNPGDRVAIDPTGYVNFPDVESKFRNSGVASGKAFNDGMEQELKKTEDAYPQKRKNRNSPHPMASKDGKDDAKAYEDAFDDQIQATARKPRRSGTSGPTSVGTGSLISIQDPKSGNVFSKERYEKQEASRAKALERVTAGQIKTMQGFSNKMMGLSFALTSVSSIIGMFGGDVGKVSQAISRMTSLLFALASITALLTRLKQAEALVTAFNIASAGMPGGGGIIKKLGRGRKAAVAGATGGKVAKAAAGAKVVQSNFQKFMSEFTRALARISPLLLRLGQRLVVFIPYVGKALAVIITVAEIFIRTRNSLFGLAETANLTSKKLETLGDIFGISPRAPGFGSAFTGASGTGTAEQRTAIELVLESDKFEKEFGLQIDSIKKTSKANAEEVLRATALQMSAAGFPEDAVQALIDAIAIKAKRTDLDLSFASINFSSEEGIRSTEKLIADSANRLRDSVSNFGTGDALFSWFGGGQLNAQINTTAATFASIFGALKTGLEDGTTSAEDFNNQMQELDSQINSFDPSVAARIVSQLSNSLGLKDELKGIKSYKDQLLLIKAETAGIKNLGPALKLLKEANKDGADPKTLKMATRLRKELTELIKKQAVETENLRIQQELEADAAEAIRLAKENLGQEIENLENLISVHEDLVRLGYDEATAYEVASNAMYAKALAAAFLSDAMGTTSGEVSRLLYILNEWLVLSDKAKQFNASGGSKEKTPQREAIEQLGQQRQEIQNNIKAYAGLRKAGFSVAEASLAAGNAILAAALASKEVGSKEWKDLVNQIKLARLEALKTSSGLRDAFSGLKSQANEYFDILEAQINRKYQDSIRSQEKAIDKLARAIEDVNDEINEYQDNIDDLQREVELNFDRPIEALNKESANLSNDLTLIDKAAEKITKRYDEQSKALSDVAKVNEKILNQQKSQVSLADALVSGDIAAAAGIMQDMAIADAAAAAITQEQMLEAARNSELAALRSGRGMSREEIEERIFDIGQKIFDLEKKKEQRTLAIRNIEDQIYAIQKNKLDPLTKQLDLAEKNLRVTEDAKQAEIDIVDEQRQRWTDAQLALELARAEAGEFNAIIKMTSDLVGDVVNGWNSLAETTKTLTIRTVTEEVGGAPTPAAIITPSPSGGGVPVRTIPDITPEPELPKEEETKPSFLDDVLGWLDEAGIKIQTWWEELWNNPWVQSIGAIFVGLGMAIAEPFQEAFDKLAKLWNEKVAEPIAKAWKENVLDPISKGWAEIQRLFNKHIGEPFNAWLQEIKIGFEKFTEPLRNAWEKFSGWVNSDKTFQQKAEESKVFFQTAFTNVGRGWDKLWKEDMPKAVDNLVNGSKRKLNEIEEFFKNLPNAAKTGFNTLATNLSSSIKIGINQLIDALNSLAKITMPERILGIRLPAGVAGASFDLWKIQKLNSGGAVSGPGTATSDSIPAMLSDGEYVVKASSVSKFGKNFLDSINAGQLPGYKLGGMIRDGGGSSKKPAAPAKSSTKTKAQIEAEERAKLAAKPATKATTPAAKPATPFQNFEAGFQNVMASIGQNPVVQAIGNTIANSPALKSILAVLSTPAEIVGAVAKNFVDTTADVIAKTKKGNLLGAAGSLAQNALTVVPKSIVQGGANAFAGVIDSNKMQPSMFEKAAQSAIDNDFFGAKTNPEMASLARIIGGTLNLAGDPLTYLGIGALSKGAKAAAAAARAKRAPVPAYGGEGLTKRVAEMLRDRRVAEAAAARSAAPVPAYGGEGLTKRVAEYFRDNGILHPAARKPVARIPQIIKSEADIGGNFSATTYQIANNKKPMVFQGLGQNFSNLSRKIDIVKPTPEGLIQQAIRSNPFNIMNNLKLRSMLNNFKNNKIGTNEQNLLDNMLASVSVGNKSDDLSGLALVVKSLTGDQAATSLLNSQRPSFLNKTAKNRKAELERSSTLYGTDVADPNSLLAIHSTKFPIKLDKDGNIVMYPTGAYNKEVSRGSIHWTLNQLVRDHLMGSWSPLEQKIIAPLSSLIKNNGLPYRADVLDTFFMKGPGEALKIKDYNIVTPMANSNQYMAELIKRGLFNSGDEIPDFAIDAARKEVLVKAPSKPVAQWSPEDMQQFLQNQGRAIEAAKEGLGVNPGPIDDAAVRNWARQNKIGIGPHSQSIPEMLEYAKDIMGYIGFSDSIEALRFGALRGAFNNPTRSILDGRFADDLPGLASGGIVQKYAKGGAVPKYMPMGGLVPYMNMGGSVKPPKREPPPAQTMNLGGIFKPKGTDTVPAMLTPGEFVINRKATQKFEPMLRAINSGSFNPSDLDAPNFSIPSKGYGAPSPTLLASSSESFAQVDNSVYNYSLSVNVEGSNSSADQIASVVMNKLRNIRSQQVRGQVVR